MIFHDSVHLSWPVSFDPPQYDLSGNEIFDTAEATSAAEVVSLPTDEVVSDDRVNVVSRYRMVLPASLAIPEGIGDGLQITWRGLTYGVDGAVERHVLRGRLHHLELLAKRVT